MNDIRYTGKFNLSPIRKDGDHTIAIRVANPSDVIFHHHDGVNFISGPIADKLYAYENLGYSTEELEKIVEKHRREVCASITINSMYGTMLKPITLRTPTSVPKDLFRRPITRQDVESYICGDINATNIAYQEWVKRNTKKPALGIKKVIFNDPATIVFWMDGSKTVVKCTNEVYDPEKGLAMAISKRALGDKGNYYEVFKKHLKEDKK